MNDTDHCPCECDLLDPEHLRYLARFVRSEMLCGEGLEAAEALEAFASERDRRTGGVVANAPIYGEGGLMSKEPRFQDCATCGGSGWIDMEGTFEACPNCLTEGVVLRGEPS